MPPAQIGSVLPNRFSKRADRLTASGAVVPARSDFGPAVFFAPPRATSAAFCASTGAEAAVEATARAHSCAGTAFGAAAGAGGEEDGRTSCRERVCPIG